MNVNQGDTEKEVADSASLPRKNKPGKKTKNTLLDKETEEVGEFR